MTFPTGWTEISGDWELSNDALRENGTPDAKVRADTPTAYNGEMYVTAVAKGFSTGDKYRIHVDWVLGTNNYYYVEFEKLGPTDDWKISLYDEGDSLLNDKTITAVGVDPDRELIACIIGGKDHSDEDDLVILKGDMTLRTPTEEFPWEIVTPHKGKYAGLGNGGSSVIDYDEFELWNPSTANRECAICMCVCEDEPIPRTLTATFEAYGVAECLDGEAVTLTWNPATGQWEGNDPGSYFCLYLSCNDGLPPLRAMCLDIETDCETNNSTCCLHYAGYVDSPVICTGGTCRENTLLTSTCEPIELEYGPWNIINADISCEICGDTSTPKLPGWFNITITD